MRLSLSFFSVFPLLRLIIEGLSEGRLSKDEVQEVDCLLISVSMKGVELDFLWR